MPISSFASRKDQRLKVLFLTPGRHVPSARFRALQYVPHLRRMGHRCTIAPAHPAMYEQYRWLGWSRSQKLRRQLRAWDLLRARLARYDVVFLQRELFDDSSWDLESRFRKTAPALILDVDDGVFLRHPEKFERLAGMCDAVIAGNALLAEKAKQYNEHVSIIPTTVDVARYTRQRADSRSSAKPIIGWTGTSGNLGELQLVEESLRDLASRVPFQLHIVSDKQEPIAQLELDGVPVHFTPWNESTETDDLQSFDIGIMPLAETEWSRYKCGLKILQYMALGIPAVASPVGVNVEIIQDGHNGFLADGPARWTEVLEQLLAEPDLRTQVGTAGRSTVEEHYSVQSQLPKLVQLFEQTLQRVKR